MGLRTALLLIVASINVQSARSAAEREPISRMLHGALEEIDLASDTAWVLRCDDGPSRPIKVPGGGWNSDQQSPRIQVMQDVRDFVVYERKLQVPQEASGQVVQLRFGAVTYGCEVYLDGQKMGDHHGPQVPFEIDLTRVAVPGKEQVLQVKAFHRRHYLALGQNKTAEIAVGWDFPEGGDEASRKEAATWSEWHGNSKVGYGIVRSVKLAILPAVHVQEVFVRPSVEKQQLACDVWVRNATDQERKITLGGTLSSWNRRDWKYPVIPSAQVTVSAHTTVKARLGPVAWDLGPESYWWPNIPFRKEYTAQLHLLGLKVTEDAKLWQAYPQRFGFVEHAEGPFYYKVNGVRYTGFSDATAEGQTSYFDSYSSPAWLPPTAPGTGAPESWRRYMQIGINTNRLHCSPPTEYMMEAADEVGFLLIPEAPIWGNKFSRYSLQYTKQTYHDMGRACRNHPSVARYSLTNEIRDWPSKWPMAIDDMREVDDIHPLVYELVGNVGRDFKVTAPKSGGHGWIMNHYTRIAEKVGEGKGIRGMGEHFWTRNSMGEYAVGIRTLRVNDWCYMSGWSWLNYWPNFLQGMSHDQHAWKPQNHADRTDGVDGWGSPIVEFTRRSLHPYLIQDLGVLAENPGEPRPLGGGGIEWPYQMASVVAGKQTERTVAIFNGGLEGNRLAFLWSAHWDKPDGPMALPVSEIPCAIEPGFHRMQKIRFTVPESGKDERRLYLVMESRKQGQTVFREEGVCLNVLKLAPTPPMGWNSYNCFGSSVTEAEFLANASYIKEKLLSSGYNTVVVDFRWADTTAANYDPNGIGGPLVADEFGRLLPSPVRFPSAADGGGFKSLADKVHAMGLKFGIHVMRGIPKQSVKANTPIEGSTFKAADAADTTSICKWCKDMWGVDATKQAGQDYYDSIFRLYASWGVDFVKVDDLSQPYHQEEIEAVRRAIDKCGRPMVVSTSPGQTPVEQASRVAANANMWRIASDFWDKWTALDHAFDLAAKWHGVAGPGHWPDGDMLPLGRIGIRCVGKDRMTHFTKEEQVTLMSLWALMPSPLMLGGHQPDNDAWTVSLITNPDMLAINQDPLGRPGRRLFQKDRTEVWVRDLKDGGKAVGLFNRGKTDATVTLNASEAGLLESGPYQIQDVWAQKNLGALGAELALPVPKHGAVLIKLTRPSK